MGGALATSGYEQYQNKFAKHAPVGGHASGHAEGRHYKDPLEQLQWAQQQQQHQRSGSTVRQQHCPGEQWSGSTVRQQHCPGDQPSGSTVRQQHCPGDQRSGSSSHKKLVSGSGELDSVLNYPLDVASSDVEKELIFRRLGYRYTGWRSEPSFTSVTARRASWDDGGGGSGSGGGGSPASDSRSGSRHLAEAAPAAAGSGHHYKKHAQQQHRYSKSGRKIGMLKKQATVAGIIPCTPLTIQTVEKCDVCATSVYAAERQEAASKIYHKKCFKCSHCNCTLNLNNYSLLEGKLFCKTHYKAVTAEAGRIDRFKDVVDSGPKETAK